MCVLVVNPYTHIQSVVAVRFQVGGERDRPSAVADPEGGHQVHLLPLRSQFSLDNFFLTVIGQRDVMKTN